MAAIGEQSLGWFSAERVEAGGGAAAGARDAVQVDVAALVGEYSGLLYRVAYSVLRNAAEAEDVVQDAFVRVLRQQRKLGAVVEMRPWLVRIAWRLAIDRRRRVRPEQMDEVLAAGLVSQEMAADDAVGEAARMGGVLRAIEALPGREREVLLLSAIEELSAAEIGVVVGRSESGVRSILFRARARLKKRLGLGEGGVR